MVTRTVVTGGG